MPRRLRCFIRYERRGDEWPSIPPVPVPQPTASLEVIADNRRQTLSAVRNGEVYAMPADYHSYGQPDTR